MARAGVSLQPGWARAWQYSDTKQLVPLARIRRQYNVPHVSIGRRGVQMIEVSEPLKQQHIPPPNSK